MTLLTDAKPAKPATDEEDAAMRQRLVQQALHDLEDEFREKLNQLCEADKTVKGHLDKGRLRQLANYLKKIEETALAFAVELVTPNGLSL